MTKPSDIQALIDRSSIGEGLRRIREHGIDAELAELEQESRAASPRRVAADVSFLEAKRRAGSRSRFCGVTVTRAETCIRRWRESSGAAASRIAA